MTSNMWFECQGFVAGQTPSIATNIQVSPKRKGKDPWYLALAIPEYSPLKRPRLVTLPTAVLAAQPGGCLDLRLSWWSPCCVPVCIQEVIVYRFKGLGGPLPADAKHGELPPNAKSFDAYFTRLYATVLVSNAAEPAQVHALLLGKAQLRMCPAGQRA